MRMSGTAPQGKQLPTPVLIAVQAMITSDVDLEVIAKCMGHEVEHWHQEETKAGHHCLRAQALHQ